MLCSRFGIQSWDTLLGETAAMCRTKGEVQERERDKKPLCKFCRQLYLKFLFSLVKGQKVERLVQHLGVSDCPLCSLMLPRIPHELLLPQRQGIQTVGRLIIVKIEKDCMHISLDGTPRGVIRKASDSDLKEPQRDGGDSINCSLIRSWLHHCKHKHGDECNVSDFALTRYRYPIELTLVDTIKRKLVEGESDWAYVALSYVWGGDKMLTMNTENADFLRKDGALSSDRPDIPSVLKDAMELVSRIGERYLWVDALCIQQDSPAKHRDLARMDVIYSHSLFALIAVDGTNANAPLPGLQPRSRLPLKPVIHIRGRVLISEPPSLDEVLESSKYETRGWTLQERLLSRRCLYMSEQGMYFQCNTSIWSETGGVKGRRRKRDQLNKFNTIRLDGRVPSHTQGVGSSTRPTSRNWSQALPIYCELVELYSARSLSYPDDVVNAFSGFSSVFAESCGGSFVAGLPTAALASSLLWISKTPLSRRRSCRGTVFPSWSWIGWEGPVTYIYGLPSIHAERSTAEIRSEMQNLEIFLNDPSSASIKLNDLEDKVTQVSAGIVQDYSLDIPESVAIRARSAEPAFRDLSPVDILRFQAWVVETTAFSISQDHGTPCSSSLPLRLSICSRDSKKQCGFFFGVQCAESAKICLGDGQFKIVAISRQKTKWNQRNDYPVLKALRIFAYGEDWDIMNVVLVKYNGNERYFERVGSGVIRSKTYEEVVVSYRTTILLG